MCIEKLNNLIEICEKANYVYIEKPTKENREFLLKHYENIPKDQQKYIKLSQEMSDIIDVFEERLTLEEVEYTYEWFQHNKLQLKEWKYRDALKDNEGCLIEYIKGEKYDNCRWNEFVKNGWKEDRCELRGCTLTIGDWGYTSDNRLWVCKKCFNILKRKQE